MHGVIRIYFFRFLSFTEFVQHVLRPYNTKNSVHMPFQIEGKSEKIKGSSILATTPK